MTFIIDFDHTLFNTTRFKEELARSVKSLEIDRKLWFETYGKTIRQVKNAYDYNARTHSQILSKKTGIPAPIIEKRLKLVLPQSDKFLYPDTKNFLKFLKNKGGKIILLTLGNIEWQKEKIKNIKIKKYFNKLIYTYWHKKYLKIKLKENPNSWIFINDDPIEIKELKKIFPQSIFLRIKRREGKKFPKKINKIKVPTFSNLAKLKNYLNKEGLA